MTADWCPYQAILCLYYRERLPYYEPIRSLPLPGPDRVQSTMIHDRTEVQIIRALDVEGALPILTRAARSALYSLPPADRKAIESLCAYCSSDLQFDFGGTAQRWVEARRGRRPSTVQPNYMPWANAVAERRRFYLRVWDRAYPTVFRLLGPLCESSACNFVS